ncbi:MAG: 16S rRNA (cytidine(1402)-2'-O)-methyltransferase [Paracoccaceae bacterium]
MNFIQQNLASGLYLVGVPIGTARDITLRALDVLASADVLAAEDTRSLRKLMEIHGIPLNGRRILTLHDHSGGGVQAQLIQKIATGQSVAYASEAGMPLIADPGFELVRATREAGHAVTTAPGPSSVTTALALAGLPTDAFHFAGFLPNAKGARQTALRSLKDIQATVVLFESPKRIVACVSDIAAILGADRQIAVCRELTKKFEEVLSGTAEHVSTVLSQRSLKGEIVLLVDRPNGPPEISEIEIDQMLSDALSKLSVKDAAALVAGETGWKRRDLYQRALTLARPEWK